MRTSNARAAMRVGLGVVALALFGACDLPPYIPPYEAPDTNIAETETDGTGNCNIEPTLSDINAKYFSLSCVFGGCHESSSKEGDLDLETASLRAQLVNVAAAHENAVGKVRVVPGDPDASFLVQKLEGTMERDEGDMMPQGIDEPIDPQCRIRMIRQWITDGALDN